MIQIIYVAIAGAIGALCRWDIGKVAVYLHSATILDISNNLPLVIEAVDTEQTIRQVLPKLDEMITDGLVTLEKVHVIRYIPK